MTTRGQDIVSVIKKQIEQFGAPLTMVDVGTVIEIGDGIARIHGLAAAKYNELLQFPNEVMGIALNLEEDSVAPRTAAAIIIPIDRGIPLSPIITSLLTSLYNHSQDDGYNQYINTDSLSEASYQNHISENGSPRLK
ncbi:unnamed protein product, partial [marine sediment metagenome]